MRALLLVIALVSVALATPTYSEDGLYDVGEAVGRRGVATGKAKGAEGGGPGGASSPSSGAPSKPEKSRASQPAVKPDNNKSDSGKSGRRGAGALPKGVAKKPEQVPDTTVKVSANPLNQIDITDARNAKTTEKLQVKRGVEQLRATGLESASGRNKKGEKPDFTSQAAMAHEDWPIYVTAAEKKLIAIKDLIKQETMKGVKIAKEYKQRMELAASREAAKVAAVKKSGKAKLAVVKAEGKAAGAA